VAPFRLWHRFGYACVNFGTPVSVREWTATRGIVLAQLPKDQRQAEVAALGRHLMAQVAQLIPVLPVPLVTMLMVADLRRARSEFEIKAEVGALVQQLQARGARLYVPRQDWDYAVSAGLRMLVQRHLVDEADGLFTPRASEAALLRYYARSIAHLSPICWSRRPRLPVRRWRRPETGGPWGYQWNSTSAMPAPHRPPPGWWMAGLAMPCCCTTSARVASVQTASRWAGVCAPHTTAAGVWPGRPPRLPTCTTRAPRRR